jgi:hypothetical protein
MDTIDTLRGTSINSYFEQVQVDFFLQHWADIRSSDTMTTVWQQIRVGRHPGFEEGL